MVGLNGKIEERREDEGGGVFSNDEEILRSGKWKERGTLHDGNANFLESLRIWKTKSKFQFPFFRDKVRAVCPVENFKGASWKLNRNRGNRPPRETILAV